MEEKDLKKVLEEYLYALKLPMFVKNYQAFAQDAARSGQSYERFLFGLAKEEFMKQQTDRVVRAIVRAKFPVPKEIAHFDFSGVGGAHPHIKCACLLGQESGFLLDSEYSTQINCFSRGEPYR